MGISVKAGERCYSFDNTINYLGVFDYKGLYRMIRQFLDHHKFTFYEKLYKDKGAASSDVDLEWWAEREVTPYVKWYFNFEWKIFDFSWIDVVKNGKKIKMAKARLRIIMQPSIEFDWQDIFEKNWFTKWLGKIYKEVIFERILNIKYAGQLEDLGWELSDKIKKFLHMETA